MGPALSDRLLERAALAGIALPSRLAASLLLYYDVLSRWNAKMNLTSLRDVDEAFDRLLLEPVAAASALPAGIRLMDLGSGGGSPAIPLALALESSELVMVESKSRKAAFLREASRAVDLRARVESVRFEDLVTRAEYAGQMHVVSMRAVRMDAPSLQAAAAFAAPTGLIALFVATGTEVVPVPGTQDPLRISLLNKAELVTLRRSPHDVPRGT